MIQTFKDQYLNVMLSVLTCWLKLIVNTSFWYFKKIFLYSLLDTHIGTIGLLSRFLPQFPLLCFATKTEGCQDQIDFYTQLENYNQQLPLFHSTLLCLVLFGHCLTIFQAQVQVYVHSERVNWGGHFILLKSQ